MTMEQKVTLIQHVMGASHVFCSTVNELLEGALQESSEGQLGMAQVKLLLLISRPEHRFKVTDIAEFLGVTNAAASRAIERLVQRGLVDRTISREDRRAVDLALTPRAEELLERFAVTRNEELLARLGRVPDEKLSRVATLLDELSLLLLDIEGAADKRCPRCGLHFRSGCVLRDVLGRACVVSTGLWGDDEHEAPLSLI